MLKLLSQSLTATVLTLPFLQVVMNIDFCGSFVSAFSAQDGCPSDCVSDVANNPGKFADAYFDM